MARITAICAVFALAGLSACTSYDPDYGYTLPAASVTPTAAVVAPAPAGTVVAVPAPAATVTVPPATVAAAPAVVPAAAPPASFRTGSGVIESIALVRYSQPVASASAGGSSPARAAY